MSNQNLNVFKFRTDNLNFRIKKLDRRVLLGLIIFFILLLLGVSGFLAYTILTRDTTPDETAAARDCSAQLANLQACQRGDWGQIDCSRYQADYNECELARSCELQGKDYFQGRCVDRPAGKKAPGERCGADSECSTNSCLEVVCRDGSRIKTCGGQYSSSSCLGPLNPTPPGSVNNPACRKDDGTNAVIGEYKECTSDSADRFTGIQRCYESGWGICQRPDGLQAGPGGVCPNGYRNIGGYCYKTCDGTSNICACGDNVCSGTTGTKFNCGSNGFTCTITNSGNWLVSGSTCRVFTGQSGNVAQCSPAEFINCNPGVNQMCWCRNLGPVQSDGYRYGNTRLEGFGCGANCDNKAGGVYSDSVCGNPYRCPDQPTGRTCQPESRCVNNIRRIVTCDANGNPSVSETPEQCEICEPIARCEGVNMVYRDCNNNVVRSNYDPQCDRGTTRNPEGYCASMTVTFETMTGQKVTKTVSASDTPDSIVVRDMPKPGTQIIFNSTNGVSNGNPRFRLYFMRPYIPDPNSPWNTPGTREYACSYYLFNFSDTSGTVGGGTAGDPNRTFTLPNNLYGDIRRNDAYAAMQDINCAGLPALNFRNGIVFGAIYTIDGGWIAPNELICYNELGYDPKGARLFDPRNRRMIGQPGSCRNYCVVRTQPLYNRPICQSFTVTGGTVENGRRILRPGESLNITMVVRNPLDRGRGSIFPYNLENEYSPGNPRGAWLPQTNVNGATPMRKLLESDKGFRWIVDGVSNGDTITFNYVIHYNQLNQPDLNDETKDQNGGWQPGRYLRKVMLRGFGGELFNLGSDGQAGRLSTQSPAQCSTIVELRSSTTTITNTPTPTFTPTPTTPTSQCTNISITNMRNNQTCTNSNTQACSVRQGDTLNIQIQGINAVSYFINYAYRTASNQNVTQSISPQSSNTFSLQIPNSVEISNIQIDGYTSNGTINSTSNNCRIGFSFSPQPRINKDIDQTNSVNLSTGNVVNSTSILEYDVSISNTGNAIMQNVIVRDRLIAHDNSGNVITPPFGDIIQATDLLRSGGTASDPSSVSPRRLLDENGNTIGSLNPGNNYTVSQNVKGVEWNKIRVLAPGETYSGTVRVDISSYTGTPSLENEFCLYRDVNNNDQIDTGDILIGCDEVIVRTAQPNFTISKQANRDTVNPGGTVNYTLTLTNVSSNPLDLSDMTVRDTLDQDAVNRITVSNIFNGGTISGNVITWTSQNLISANNNNPNLAPNSSIQLTYTITINQNYFPSRGICNDVMTNQARAISTNRTEQSNRVNINIIGECATPEPPTPTDSPPPGTTTTTTIIVTSSRLPDTNFSGYINWIIFTVIFALFGAIAWYTMEQRRKIIEGKAHRRIKNRIVNK